MKNIDEKRIEELLAKEATLTTLQKDVEAKKQKELRYAAKQSILLHKAKIKFGTPSDAEADAWLADKEKVKIEITVALANVA